jgi:hypothetical protein
MHERNSLLTVQLRPFLEHSQCVISCVWCTVHSYTATLYTALILHAGAAGEQQH